MYISYKGVIVEIDAKRLLHLYKEYTSILGPYIRKDGRKHIVLNNKNLSKKDKHKLKTISYPKAIYESQTGKLLKDNETIDHYDRNHNNNSLDNIQVLDRAKHVQLDIVRRDDNFNVKCFICDTNIPMTRARYDTRSKVFCCSRKCSGLYGSMIQNSLIKNLPNKKVKKRYYIDKYKKSSVLELYDELNLSLAS